MSVIAYDGTGAPRLIVEAAFGTTLAGAPDPLALVLGGTVGLGTAKLGGITWVDITDDVDSVTWGRGRDDNIGHSAIGTADVVLDNSAGVYDPANLAGPYVVGGVSTVDAGVSVRIRAVYAGVTYGLFYGDITEVQVDYGYSSTATFSCSDGLEWLGRTFVEQPAGTTGDLDFTGQRIGRLLDEAGWPDSRRMLDTGATRLGPPVWSDFALALMQAVETTELGFLFVDGDGDVVFYDRHHITSATRSTVPQAQFVDNNSGTSTPSVGADPSFEAGLNGATASGFFGGPTPSLSQSTLHPTAGTHTLRVDWATGGQGLAALPVTGLAVGKTYRVTADAFVPTGSPDVQLGVAGITFGEIRTVKNAGFQLVVQFTAAATTASLQLIDQTPSGVGTSAFLDNLAIAQVDGVEYSDLRASRSRARVYNVAHITRNAYGDGDQPIEQVASDAASVATYGSLSYPDSVGQLVIDDNEAKALAEFLVGRFKTPSLLISNLVAEGITQPAVWPTLLALQLFDRVSVTRNYGPNTVATQLLIEGMRCTATPGGQWTIELSTAPTQGVFPLFQLGTARLGVTGLGY